MLKTCCVVEPVEEVSDGTTHNPPKARWKHEFKLDNADNEGHEGLIKMKDVLTPKA